MEKSPSSPVNGNISKIIRSTARQIEKNLQITDLSICTSISWMGFRTEVLCIRFTFLQPPVCWFNRVWGGKKMKFSDVSLCSLQNVSAAFEIEAAGGAQVRAPPRPGGGAPTPPWPGNDGRSHSGGARKVGCMFGKSWWRPLSDVSYRGGADESPSNLLTPTATVPSLEWCVHLS